MISPHLTWLKKQQQLLTETQTAPHSETCDELFPLTLGYYPLAIYLGMYIYIYIYSNNDNINNNNIHMILTVVTIIVILTII